MNKKFISVLMAAAATFGTVSTFTSCKDYDDDIAALQTLIDKNADAIQKINDLIKDGGVITALPFYIRITEVELQCAVGVENSFVYKAHLRLHAFCQRAVEVSEVVGESDAYTNFLSVCGLCLRLHTEGKKSGQEKYCIQFLLHKEEDSRHGRRNAYTLLYLCIVFFCSFYSQVS